MTPQPPEQEWIISDKDYHIALEYFHLVARPLSDELKKERNKLVVEMLSAIPNEGMPVWEERGYLKFINSFRSEE